jgi:trehalose-6-phosphate synthase
MSCRATPYLTQPCPTTPCRAPNNLILLFFLHVPFPPPEILTALPNHEWLIPQLAAYNLVGFQTESDATNFARVRRAVP